MSKQKFLNTKKRVEDILVAEPYSREDDIFLTWRYWKTIRPDLESLSMLQFKRVFLEGDFGLPASITRARAQIQNKTNPSLKGMNASRKSDRAEFWTTWFRDNSEVEINSDLQVLKNYSKIETEDDLDLEEEKSQEINKYSDGVKLSPSENFNINTKQLAEEEELRRQLKKIDQEIQEDKYYTLDEYLEKYLVRISINKSTEKLILFQAHYLTQWYSLKSKLIQGKGINSELFIAAFKREILKESIEKVLTNK